MSSPDVYYKVWYERHHEMLRRQQTKYYERNMLVHRDAGAALREARQAAGISQRRLAARIGRCESSVSQYETGRVPIPWDRILPILPELEEVANACQR